MPHCYGPSRGSGSGVKGSYSIAGSYLLTGLSTGSYLLTGSSIGSYFMAGDSTGSYFRVGLGTPLRRLGETGSEDL